MDKKFCIVPTLWRGNYREYTCFHRVAEVYFPSMQALEACFHSTGGQETLEHSVEISTGGTPVFLTAEVGYLDF